MARLSSEDREKILADFHIGESQNSLAKKYGVSPATINKICKGITPKFKDKVNTVTSIKRELIEESEYQSECFDAKVNDNLKHLIFFQNSALKNQELANKQLNEDSELYDLKLHADLTSKNKQTVLGKDIDTQVNINNQNNQQTIQEIGVTFLDENENENT